MSFPVRYQLPAFKPYRKEPGVPALDDQATTGAFRAIAAALHAEFFAEHPDTEVFANIVKLLLAKIFDERQRRAREQYVFQVLQVNGREETAVELFGRIRPLYEEAYTAYIDPAGGDTLDPKVFSAERVKSVVKGLQSVAITRGTALQGDVIGAFFEEILRAGFKQDKGMYFTHSNIVWFMLEAINLKQLTIDTWKRAKHPNDRMPYVIDPACGSGAFLLRAMQMMSGAIRSDRASLVATQDDERFFESHLADNNPNEWAKDFLYGCDPKFVMAITAKVNMVLHGDGSAHIYKSDALQPFSELPDVRLRPTGTDRSVSERAYPYDVCEQFDVVVSNPPFGISLSPNTKKHVPQSYSLGPATSSESLFLERWAQLLKPMGRLAVVIPESLLNGAEYRASRLFLYRFFWIRAVVSLPRGLFIETPTLTSLLFAQKKDAEALRLWDEQWDDAASKIYAAVDGAEGECRTAANDNRATPSSVESAFLDPLRRYIDDDKAVVKRGRTATVMSIKLPSEIRTAEEALKYYLDLAKTAGFASLIEAAIFREVVASTPQEWKAYMVDEVGYKLSKRGERVRPNQLCRFADAGKKEWPNAQLARGDIDVLIDSSDPQTVLDYIRKDIVWA